MITRTHFILIVALLITMYGCSSNVKQEDQSNPLDYKVRVEVPIKHWDGVFNWTQARVVAIPGFGKEGQPRLIMTMQKWFVAHSDYYSGLFTIQSDDMGTTWTGPKEQPALGWRHVEDNIVTGICDFTPGWHKKSGKVLALGHTVYYVEGGKLMENRPRSTAYAVYDPEADEWSAWKQMKPPDENKFFNSGSGCGQWLVKPDGTLLVPAYFKAKGDTTNCYASTIFHCRFDGEELTYIEHGDELSLGEPRGVYEPSLTAYNNRYYLTLRNDGRAYVSVSDDAMHWQPIKPWTFDNGQEIGSYNTQQHWATHSDGLFLVYTRRDTTNEHIPRSRAPLFMAAVDTDRLVVQKESERIVIPQRGVMMGNFGVSRINSEETWVTVGENMRPPENFHLGSDGSVFAARIYWPSTNK
ncbi:MAG: exo-alpha-sialidase [Bacteroidota bacterium]